MNPQNGHMYDLFDRDQFTADDYHQDYTEGLYQKERFGIGTFLSVSAIVIALAYQGLINLDYDLLPPSQLAWKALVYLTPSALLDYADHYSNPLPIRNPNTMTYPQTHAQKSEMMRRLFGLDTPGGIIDSVASAGRRRLSTLPLIGGLGVVGDDETPAGLGNWDNSVYQNSILQGLASLDSLPDFLESFQNDEALQQRDKSNNGRRIWNTGSIENMSSWQQQDAQEYFFSSSWRNRQRQPSHTQALFPNPLTGLTATRVVCTKCGYSEGLKTTPSLCQPLIVGEGWEYDLSQLLHEGTKLEFVNGVYCERCTLQKSQHLLSTLMERLKAEPEDNRIRINTSERLRAVTEALENDDFAEKTLKDKCKIPIENWVSVTKSKQDIIARPPKSLALHLNRSTYGPDGELSKKTAAIRFPKYLDLGPYCLGSAGHNDEEHDNEEWLLAPYDSMVAGIRKKSRIQGPVYELRAVVTHSGRHDNGHYICYRRHPVSEIKTDENGSKQDQWWRLSDDHVIKVSEDNVLAQGGVFMLFYDQIEPAVHLSALDSVTDTSMQDAGIEKSACSSQSETTPFTSRETISNSTKITPLTETDDADHIISRSSSSSNLSDVDTYFTNNENHDNEEITASEGSDRDEDTKQTIEARYTPTKPILIPQPYMRTSKSKNGRDSSEGTRENNMGGLLMV
ncbi:uncharacterized protein EAF02_006590 [Botrytis sinoallii]|uniref:uncharacterized protein n=1 Tax=Botrytis sinoallii TaxID=1463999 RepID=UPI0018FF84F1|nr:uncharacterized protein EAF02_006590 [Botrytis sinoallii]KAF7881902.1 hypothetical protein EAF02_006590 [Botrytis sinoallii]